MVLFFLKIIAVGMNSLVLSDFLVIDHYSKDVVCPDGSEMFRRTAKKLGNENFYKGKFLD